MLRSYYIFCCFFLVEISEESRSEDVRSGEGATRILERKADPTVDVTGKQKLHGTHRAANCPGG